MHILTTQVNSHAFRKEQSEDKKSIKTEKSHSKDWLESLEKKKKRVMKKRECCS